MPGVDGLTVSRRHFLGALAGGLATSAATAVGARTLLAQQSPQPTEPAAQGSDPAANQGAANVPMDEGAYRPVRLQPKPGAAPSMTVDERDALEHQIHCQCGCALDIFTCRTTDFSCGLSPAMHRDVMSLVEGGYSADEILAAFRGAYGERALMSPVKEGFNWAGYVTPFAALGAGGLVVAALIRKWGREAEQRIPPAEVRTLQVAASPDELARIDAAVREDGR